MTVAQVQPAIFLLSLVEQPEPSYYMTNLFVGSGGRAGRILRTGEAR